MSTKVFGLDLGKTKRNLATACHFWADALRLTLPGRMRRQLTVGKEYIIVEVSQGQLQVKQEENTQSTLLGEFDYDTGLVDPALFALLRQQAGKDKTLILAVPDAQVLVKPVDFPVAVADNIKQTLFYELDKHTPFSKDQVLYDTQIITEKSNKVLANLYLLHKPLVADLLELFKNNNIYFDRLCSASQLAINLLPTTLRRKKAFWGINRNVFLSLLCLCLLLIALATPLMLKRQTAVTLDQQIGVLSPQADGEITLWERRDQAEETLLNFLQTHPLSFSQVYEELSKRLPDHTFVTNLDFRHGKITLTGESADAAALIATLNASPLFENAKILSPIVKSRQSNKEIYQIAFDLVSAPEAS